MSAAGKLSETRLDVATKCTACPTLITAGARAYRKMSRRDGYPLLCPRCATGEGDEVAQGAPALRIEKTREGGAFVCRHCGEEIYFANRAWRHRSSKRAEAIAEKRCPKCDGQGSYNLGPRSTLKQRCMKCFGLGIVKVVTHDAEPLDEEAQHDNQEPRRDVSRRLHRESAEDPRDRAHEAIGMGDAGDRLP